MEELLARAAPRCAARGPDEPSQPTLRYGGLEVDLARRLVTRDGEPCT